MNHTTYYQLSLWEQDDLIQMEDFNADNEKIAAALKAQAENISALQSGKANSATVGALTTRVADLEAGKADQTALESTAAALLTAIGSSGHTCRMEFGSYVGTGLTGSKNPLTLTFSCCPMLVYLFLPYATGMKYAIMPRPAVRVTSVNGTGPAYLTWDDHSVTWYGSDDANANNSGTTYYYLALGYDAAEEETA